MQELLIWLDGIVEFGEINRNAYFIVIITYFLVYNTYSIIYFTYILVL